MLALTESFYSVLYYKMCLFTKSHIFVITEHRLYLLVLYYIHLFVSIVLLPSVFIKKCTFTFVEVTQCFKLWYINTNL